MSQPLMWSIGFGAAYLGIGIMVGNRMFDYPVGSFWHVLVALFWPLLVLPKLFGAS